MRPFANSPVWKLIDWAGDKTAISPRWITSLLTIQYAWGDGKPDWTNLRISVFGTKHEQSLYYNGVLFFRVMLPFYIGLQIRWSGATDKRAFLQTHAGWKLNGRLALAFRVQSDATGERGMDFPNWGQAKGWQDGTK